MRIGTRLPCRHHSKRMLHHVCLPQPLFEGGVIIHRVFGKVFFQVCFCRYIPILLKQKFSGRIFPLIHHEDSRESNFPFHKMPTSNAILVKLEPHSMFVEKLFISPATWLRVTCHRQKFGYVPCLLEKVYFWLLNPKE